MRWLRLTVFVLGTMVTLTLGGLFFLQNNQPIPLDLLVLQLPGKPFAIWILLAFALGVLLGTGVGSLLILPKNISIRDLRKQKAALDYEINLLKSGASRE